MTEILLLFFFNFRDTFEMTGANSERNIIFFTIIAGDHIDRVTTLCYYTENRLLNFFFFFLAGH